eukprot:scaffold15333_cov146-Skeletonema_dohrnii-CCMP3373.AAC.1
MPTETCSLVSTEREIIESTIGSRQITNRSLQWGAIRSDHHGSTHWKHPDREFINTFADEISNRVNVKTILRNLYIKNWQSEPHHQNQKIVERFIQELKKYANWTRNTSGAPLQTTFLILKYVCFIFNRTAQGNLSWRTLCEALNGQTPDVSMLLHWQRVYIKDYCEQLGTGFPFCSNEPPRGYSIVQALEPLLILNVCKDISKL